MHTAAGRASIVSPGEDDVCGAAAHLLLLIVEVLKLVLILWTSLQGTFSTVGKRRMASDCAVIAACAIPVLRIWTAAIH